MVQLQRKQPEKPATLVRQTMRNLWKNPIYIGGMLLIYVITMILLLLNLNRADLWYPLQVMIIFPLLVFAPFMIISAPLGNLFKGISLVLLLGVLMPLIGLIDTTYLELVIQISIFSALALGLNIVVGFAGLLDLGYVAFWAVGAYVWAVFTSASDTIFRTGFEFAPLAIGGNTLIQGFHVNPMVIGDSGYMHIAGTVIPIQAFYIFIFIGAILAALTGILLGLPVLRLRGDYLAIVTLGFGEIIRVLANNLGDPGNITGGAQGLHDVGKPSVDFLIQPVINVAQGIDLGFLKTPTINAKLTTINFAAPVAQQLLFYVLAIVIVGVIIILAQRLDNSPIGRAWTAIREDEVAAIAMGVPLVRMKLLAFATGAACAGAVGVLYGAKQTFVSPESFQLIQSINILAMVIVGGMGGIRGVIFGAAIVTLLNLHVLTNFALQISALRNVDYVIPGWFLLLVLVVLALLIIGVILRNTRQIYDAVQRRNSRTLAIGVTVIVAVLLVTRIADFPVANWPSQLTPDKYQRFVFGILLVAMMIFRPEGLLPSARRRMELHKEDSIPESEAA
jgi:branched-chain amino acid transport system permease protein